MSTPHKTYKMKALNKIYLINKMKTWKNIKTFLVFSCITTLMSFILIPLKHTTIYLIGDSTMADKAISTYPETGWGMAFKYYFDSTIIVDNRAQNGRSTRTFVEEGRWKDVLSVLKKGDYVLIQFGHNDEVATKRSYTPPAQYISFLKQFIKDSKSKGAFPVLITPVTRRSFTKTQTGADSLIDTHKVYGQLVRQVAKAQQVPLIDLEKLSMDLLSKFGAKNSALLYNHLTAGENPHYPKGHEDNTHFNELGARKMAEIVINAIARQQLPLAHHIDYAKK